MIPEQRAMAAMTHLIAHEGVEPDAIERAVNAALDVPLGASIVEHVAADANAGPLVLVRSFVMEQATRLFKR